MNMTADYLCLTNAPTDKPCRGSSGPIASTDAVQLDNAEEERLVPTNSSNTMRKDRKSKSSTNLHRIIMSVYFSLCIATGSSCDGGECVRGCQTGDDILKIIEAGCLQKLQKRLSDHPSELETKIALTEKGEKRIDLLTLTAMYGHPNCAKFLIEKGLDVDVPCDKLNGFTPAMTAAMKGNAETLRILIDAGADLKRKTTSSSPDDEWDTIWFDWSFYVGCTALHFAAEEVEDRELLDLEHCKVGDIVYSRQDLVSANFAFLGKPKKRGDRGKVSAVQNNGDVKVLFDGDIYEWTLDPSDISRTRPKDGGHAKCVQYLLDIDALDSWPPACSALDGERDVHDIFVMLLNHGADPTKEKLVTKITETPTLNVTTEFIMEMIRKHAQLQKLLKSQKDGADSYSLKTWKSALIVLGSFTALLLVAFSLLLRMYLKTPSIAVPRSPNSSPRGSRIPDIEDPEDKSQAAMERDGIQDQPARVEKRAKKPFLHPLAKFKRGLANRQKAKNGHCALAL